MTLSDHIRLTSPYYQDPMYFYNNEQKKKKKKKKKKNNETSATNEDKPAHPSSLIRGFADDKCLLQPTGFPMRNGREALPYWLICVIAGHTGLIVVFVLPGSYSVE